MTLSGVRLVRILKSWGAYTIYSDGLSAGGTRQSGKTQLEGSRSANADVIHRQVTPVIHGFHTRPVIRFGRKASFVAVLPKLNEKAFLPAVEVRSCQIVTSTSARKATRRPFVRTGIRLCARSRTSLSYRLLLPFLTVFLFFVVVSPADSNLKSGTPEGILLGESTIMGSVGTYQKWSKVEIEFTGPNSLGMDSTNNPFKIQMDVTFVGPSGSYVVPAFYDGNGSGGMNGNVWKVRFSPDAAGSWTFVSNSTDPLLTGHTGTFDVIDPTGCGTYVPGGLADFGCVGRLESSGGHYLKFAEGPYWLKGGADDPEDFLGPGVTVGFASKNAAIDYLASKGVNSLYFMTNNVGGDGQNVWPWAGSNQAAAKANHEQFDVAKLSQWEQLFEYMQSKGVVLHLVLEDDSGWTGFNRQMYYREMIARFGHFNALVWNLAEEYNENYSASAAKNFAQLIRDLDAYDHPIAVHNQGSLSNWSPFLGDDRFDITSFQTVDSPQNAAAVTWFQKVENSGRTIAISFDETGKLDVAERTKARHIAWSVYMGGANYEIHTSPLISYSDFAGHLEDLTRARGFIEALPFWEMRPANNLLTSGTGYVFAKSGEVYAVYLPSGGSLGLDLTSNTNNYDIQWFNPKDGSVTFGGTLQGGVVVSLNAPSSNDWALSLRKVSGTGNTIPIANGQNINVQQGNSVSINLSFSDPDGPGPFVFSTVQQPANGTLGDDDGDSLITYIPNVNFVGTDGFTWKVNDGFVDSNHATVTVTVVAPANASPIAQDQTVGTNRDVPLAIQLAYVDADGPGPFTVTITLQPSNGMLTGTDNDRTYTPNAGFVGTDSFAWKVNDGIIDSIPATVSINVNPGCPTISAMGTASRDNDQDGLCEDLNGNARFDFGDIVGMFQNISSVDVQNNASYYDFDGNGLADMNDVVVLFGLLVARYTQFN